jgi:hypothetical protein
VYCFGRSATTAAASVSRATAPRLLAADVAEFASTAQVSRPGADGNAMRGGPPRPPLCAPHLCGGDYLVLFFDETHLPNALLALPPYLAVKAARDSVVVPRSALQALEAFIRAVSCCAEVVSAFFETHLP